MDEEDHVENGMRCLFEMNLPEDIIEKKFRCSFHDNAEYCIKVKCTRGDPGALQSGKYLWPACNYLCEYLCKNELPCPNEIIELGSGSGMTGLLVCKLYPQTKVMFTDRDAFLLEMITSSSELSNVSNFETEILNWGQADEAQDELDSILSEHTFDFVIGTDVCYSTDSIHALFFTVQKLLRDSQGKYIQCSSFRVQESTEIIEDLCLQYGLERKVLHNTMHEKQNQYLIESFQCVD